jgi:hypothetical protein
MQSRISAAHVVCPSPNAIFRVWVSARKRRGRRRLLSRTRSGRLCWLARSLIAARGTFNLGAESDILDRPSAHLDSADGQRDPRVAEYKKNHYIPRAMLNYWVTKPGKYPGVHVFDVREQQQIFSSASGQKAFSFAIVDDLYVPKVDGRRAVSLEKWMSSLEGPFLAIVAQAHAGQGLVLKTNKDQTRVAMALRAMEVRSRYQLERIKLALVHNPALSEIIGGDLGENLEQLVLQNLINTVSEKAAWLRPLDLTFLHTTDESLVLSDRPFFEYEPGLNFMVITNRVFVAYRRSESGVATYSHVDASAGFVTEINRAIASRGRDWLVADNAEQRDRYAKVFSTAEWHEAVKADKVEVEPVFLLTKGWKIPPDKG